MKFFKTVICILSIFFSQKSYSQNGLTDTTVTDFDGNVYPIVQIGNQIWMAENLRTTHYSDGTPINYSLGLSEVAHNDTTERFFYYDDNPVNAEIYGCLYSWYAAVRGTNCSSTNPSGIQGVSPAGWHIPSRSEWEELISFLGENAADQLKTGGWTGFNAVYGGAGGDYKFQQINSRGFYLMSDGGNVYDIDKYCDIPLLGIEPNNSNILFGYHTKTCGYSVRCLRDDINTGLDNENISETPHEFTLQQNYPNPFNPSTTIEFILLKSEFVELKVYNILGKEVATLVSNKLNQGNHTYQFDGSGLASGVYYYRIQAGDFHQVKKMILLR